MHGPDQRGAISFRTLAAAQLGVFAAQELAERAVVGDAVARVLTERGVWFGLLAQVAVAYAVTRSIDAVRRVVRSLTAGGRVLGSVLRPAAPSVPVGAPATSVGSVAVGLRAPPPVAR